MDDKIDGRSLVPLLNNESFIENSIYIESASVTPTELTGNVVGIRNPQYKYFRSRKSSKVNVHLYDLKTDPFEESNLAKTNLEVVQKMELILFSFLEKADNTILKNTIDEETKEIHQELKKLGYV